jgi:hypothetical protein
MILGHILLDEIWGAKVERKILKSNTEVQSGKDISCYLISVTVPIVL